jgi:hypothetical protein
MSIFNIKQSFILYKHLAIFTRLCLFVNTRCVYSTQLRGSFCSRMLRQISHLFWTEDMIQSRHRLAQLYGFLRIALRSCYWQNHFIEHSCYLRNHLWTTAELTVDNRLSPYARNALHRYVINMSSNVLFPTYTYLWSWQCFYWLKISRCKYISLLRSWLRVYMLETLARSCRSKYF